MHRVRAWAHSSAHQSRFNPWSRDGALAATVGAPSADTNLSRNPTGEPEKDKPKIPVTRRFLDTAKKVIFHSWINVLLIFVPVGIAVHFANVNPGAVFAINAVAIVPLAGLLTFATESVAHRLGPTLGALMNVSFGNAVELIIFIIALVKNEIRIVQAALIGSILANLLLILGMAFLIGGLEYREQVYDSLVTQMSACLLALSVLSLLIPTAFHFSFNDMDLANEAVLKLSRGTSIILLLTYLLYLAFQLKSHSYLYQGTPQHVIDAQSAPGFLARFDSSSTSSTSMSILSATESGSQRHVRKRLRAKLGRKRRTKTETEEAAGGEGVAGDQNEKGKDKALALPDPPAAVNEDAVPTSLVTNKSNPPSTPRGLSFRTPPVFRSSTDPQAPLKPNQSLRRLRTAPNHASMWTDDSTTMGHQPRIKSDLGIEQPSDEPPMSQTASIILLLVSTGLVALCAEFLVGSIQSIVETSPLSEAFIGLIILPIVGNAAEHVTAVTVAAKNKLDLALGVALGSSIQIALFVTPLVVVLGWIMDKEMSLYFNLFETVAIFVSTFIVNFLVLDGRSNYLEGALLCVCYIIIAVAAYLFPDSENQSLSTAGPGT